MQDFVKSGQWSEVRDLENTGLKTLDNAFSDYESKKNFSRANPNTRYVNQKEIDDWNKQWGSSGDTPVEGMANGGQAHYNKAKQVVESTQDLIDKFVEMYEKASGKEPKPPKEVFRDPWDMKDGGAPLRRDVSELIPFSPHLPSAVSAGLDWVKGKVLDEAKTYSNPRAIPDVATNVAADWVGMPVDIAKILADVADYGGEKVANAITGRSSKKLSDLVKEDEHEKPTFGSSEYIKDYLKEKGVTTGTERPISEFAAFPVAPALLRGATRTGKKYLNQPPHLTQKEYDDILSGQPPRKLRNVNELHPLY